MQTILICMRRYTQKVQSPSPPSTSENPILVYVYWHRSPTADALASNLSTLSTDALKRAEKDAQKKALKASQNEEREAEKRATSKVFIKRIERNKRKYVTCISGLENFGFDIKKIAKEFGKKFATGSSVTKVPGGGEEITVQGDLAYDIEEFVLETWKEIPEDNVEVIEEKKKKGGGWVIEQRWNIEYGKRYFFNHGLMIWRFKDRWLLRDFVTTKAYMKSYTLWRKIASKEPMGL